ncbi:hypothetical protein D7Z26_16120 [Cohnella endophytica]|uniref:Uncharacterized protein n=1 Tax=Cohnella endophytica TaxID=2419778 RepID=A0A494XKS8_9BACL|nr:hypothetical protein [Cohnella endophytica]RKP51325.1 hypothetical protein D7Z26_16120 [Cohnella endophytica]
MSNTAAVSQQGSFYYVQVNGTSVTSYGDLTSATNTVKRLNALFSDPNRDLDFITPSYSTGYYLVVCPLVRKNVSQLTYLYDTNSADGWRSYPEKLYESTILNDGFNQDQTLLIALPSATTNGWYSALNLANNIRAAVNLNFADALGRTTCQSLVVPTNTGTSTSLISSSAICDFYGVPCQGTQAGTQSSCPEIGYAAQNILNVSTGNGEVFHPAGLTASMTTTNSWSTLYKNKFVKVTNISNSQSIVVKVTDTSPANRGVELGYRAWVEIGKPSGAGTVKIELMS